MNDMILMGTSFAALLAAYPLLALYDVLRHREPRFQVHVPEGRMTAQGVPYVPGNTTGRRWPA